MSNYKSYSYASLSTEVRSFRLLRVKVSQYSPSGIECSLFHSSIDNHPTYVALSYVWGDPTNKIPIIVDGMSFEVTLNLESALRHLCLYHHFELDNPVLTIWVDAICIDQKNDGERTQQIQLMCSLYENAKGVVVWLGDQDQESDRACEFLEMLGVKGAEMIQRDGGDYKKFQQHMKSELESAGSLEELPDFRGWEALGKLFKRPWFNRVWVIQEFASAEQVGFICGRRSVSWKELQTVHFAMEAMKTESFFHGAGYPQFEALIWWRLNAEFRRTNRRSLLSLLTSSISKGATDPRDKVFALLGLADETTSLPSSSVYIADYSKTVAEVYREAAQYLITTHRTLEVLSWCTAFHRVPNLPSWVPDWTLRSEDLQQFLGTPAIQANQGTDLGKGINRASGNSFAAVDFSQDLSILKLKGIKVGRIRKICPPDKNITATMELWENFVDTMGSELYTTGESKLVAFVRTTIRNIDPQNLTVMASWRCVLAYLIWSDRLSPEEGLELLHRVEKRNQTLQKEVVNSLHDYFEAYNQYMPLCVVGKSFALSDDGLFGLVPKEAEEGDIICVFLGGGDSYVLRKTPDYHRLVGNCYLHGMGNGEALVGVDSGIYTLEDYELE